jgi:hypothetical protein
MMKELLKMCFENSDVQNAPNFPRKIEIIGTTLT